MPDHRPPVSSVVEGLTTKADKIRALDRAGYTRSEIAEWIGVRYQHVRNVLEDQKRLGPPRTRGGMAEASQQFEGAPQTAQRINVGKNGEVRIPQVMLDAAGVKEGDTLLVHFEDDDIRLCTTRTALRRAQAEVRKYIPEGVSLADELIRERHAEAERELRDD